MALYRAKDTGRNQYHFHSEALDVAIIERVTLASDLRHGLDRGEFELYYQPQVEATSGRIIGIEALARWHHPKQGMLLPGHFIPIAEKTGAILPLGRWVIDQVCRQINAWRTEQLTPPIVALNVSALQMKSVPEFDAELMHSLKTWEIEPAAIEIELTESVLMATTREHRGIIDRLNENGISIAIDDFGTGYSSLSYLRAYRVSHIKIAQEFIQHIEEGSGDVAIVRAALSLARELGIKVIAEGVETAFQLRLLVEAGCQYVQGYYFSPPVPAATMADMLRHKVLSPAGTPGGSRAD
jgi:EAL domain-containing protein (putative c-di-GMP-specific phosphodiesterase class I)